MKSAARSALLCGAVVLAAHLATVAGSGLLSELSPAVREAIGSISGDLLRFQLALAAGVFVAGACAGLVGHAALRLLRLSTRPAALLGLLGVLALVFRTMARKPALFDSVGGRGRALLQ